jgi:hypothetical protein
VRLPDRPHIGLVLSYSYLWADEAKAGKEEGAKIRPAAIVLARTDFGPSELVYVVPVTHSPPTEDGEKLAIPSLVKRHLGLDDEASWIDVTEVNVFVWPGVDLRPVRSHGEDRDGDAPCFYGFLPRGVFKQVQRALAQNRERGKVRVVARSK